LDLAHLQILGFGTSTPIGRNAWASAAAARAGICGFSEHPFMIDTAGEPMRVARAPWIDMSVEGTDRFAALLFPAIDEVLEQLTANATASSFRLGLALALPPRRAGQPHDLANELLTRIESRYANRFKAVLSFEVGHAAGHLAIDAATKGCTAGSIDACVVCGVDSYLSPETLEWIEACDQLHGGGPLNNAWGFIPGEAAGAVLFGTSDFVQNCGMVPFAEVAGLGIGYESNLIKTDAVCLGEGLTQAFRQAFRTIAAAELVQNVFCDLNGEPYRADEYGFTALRTKEHFRAANDFVAPADCWGDVGAAGSLLHIALAAISHRKHYGRGPLSMVWASSESSERGAVLVRSVDFH
jgi:3-oxoacyl-[acyl-carrier-protein] synthase I